MGVDTLCWVGRVSFSLDLELDLVCATGSKSGDFACFLDYERPFSDAVFTPASLREV